MLAENLRKSGPNTGPAAGRRGATSKNESAYGTSTGFGAGRSASRQQIRLRGNHDRILQFAFILREIIHIARLHVNRWPRTMPFVEGAQAYDAIVSV